MNVMITASLVLNIAVLTPVCLGLLTDAPWTGAAYGEKSPARDILVSIYLAILLVSIAFLFWRAPIAVAARLTMQVIYKAITPIAVGTVSNPVVVSNLFIAAFHTVTLVLIWMASTR